MSIVLHPKLLRVPGCERAGGRYSNLVPRVFSQDPGNEVSKRSSRKFRIVLAVK